MDEWLGLLREMKKSSFCFTERTYFLKDIDKNDRFLLNERFFETHFSEKYCLFYWPNDFFPEKLSFFLLNERFYWTNGFPKLSFTKNEQKR